MTNPEQERTVEDTRLASLQEAYARQATRFQAYASWVHSTAPDVATRALEYADNEERRQCGSTPADGLASDSVKCIATLESRLALAERLVSAARDFDGTAPAWARLHKARQAYDKAKENNHE